MKSHAIVRLSEEEREQLTKLTRSGVTSVRVVTRARILLLADRSRNERRTYPQIAEALQVSIPTISTICRRFTSGGLNCALQEKPRPGRVPKITGEVEAQLTSLACSDPPEGKSQWTMQLLADKLVELSLVESISDSAVCERLKKMRSSLGR